MAGTAIPTAHSHDFHCADSAAERGTRLVFWITAVAMVVEIAAGWWFNSMALLADGWHMSSHALAIGLSAFAYAASRRYADDARFAFGTWKVEVLAGFASAIMLVGVALLMVIGSVQRLFAPEPIQYKEALLVACAGLGVNIACAFILGGAHYRGHDHHHGHGHGGTADHGNDHAHGHDLNLRSAYVHVITDAATSVLAIVALVGGWLQGWSWMDPVMGLVGAVVVAVWARGLISQTAKVLLDREMDHPVVQEIREALESDTEKVTDLHVWRVGGNRFACAVALSSANPGYEAAEARRRISIHEEVMHATIEVAYVPPTGPYPIS